MFRHQSLRRLVSRNWDGLSLPPGVTSLQRNADYMYGPNHKRQPWKSAVEVPSPTGWTGSGNTCSNNNGIYRWGADTWTSRTVTPQPVYNQGGNSVGMGSHKWGGYDGTFRTQHDRYQHNTDAWSTLQAYPRGIFGQGSDGEFVWGGHLFGIGGWNGSSLQSAQEHYSIFDNSWTGMQAYPTASTSQSYGLIKAYVFFFYNNSDTGTNTYTFSIIANSFAGSTAAPVSGERVPNRAYQSFGVTWIINTYDTAARTTVRSFNAQTAAYTTRGSMSTAEGAVARGQTAGRHLMIVQINVSPYTSTRSYDLGTEAETSRAADTARKTYPGISGGQV